LSIINTLDLTSVPLGCESFHFSIGKTAFARLGFHPFINPSVGAHGVRPFPNDSPTIPRRFPGDSPACAHSPTIPQRALFTGVGNRLSTGVRAQALRPYNRQIYSTILAVSVHYAVSRV